VLNVKDLYITEAYLSFSSVKCSNNPNISDNATKDKLLLLHLELRCKLDKIKFATSSYAEILLGNIYHNSERNLSEDVRKFISLDTSLSFSASLSHPPNKPDVTISSLTAF